MSQSYAALLEAVSQLKAPKVLVVGDLILDEYIEGEIQRISREAPVPIVEENKRHYLPGGAANTLMNLAVLGADTRALGVVGSDLSGEQLKTLLRDAEVSVEDVVTAPEVPTTTKTRISAQSRQSVMQQVLRLDRLPQNPLTEATRATLCTQIQRAVQQADVVIISDYGKGVVVPEIIETLRQEVLQHDKIWIVDSQEDLRLFHGAALLTPNKPEAENNLGRRIEGQEALRVAGSELLAETGAQAVLITCGDEGMALFEQGQPMATVPALNRADVFDVTGAGDTVVATLALALGSGCALPTAMALANLAASIVIRRYGCSTTTPQEMAQNLRDMQKKSAV